MAKCCWYRQRKHSDRLRPTAANDVQHFFILCQLNIWLCALVLCTALCSPVRNYNSIRPIIILCHLRAVAKKHSQLMYIKSWNRIKNGMPMTAAMQQRSTSISFDFGFFPPPFRSSLLRTQLTIRDLYLMCAHQWNVGQQLLSIDLILSHDGALMHKLILKRCLTPFINQVILLHANNWNLVKICSHLHVRMLTNYTLIIAIIIATNRRWNYFHCTHCRAYEFRR